jgi:outer membrane protein assembly factor BamB
MRMTCLNFEFRKGKTYDEVARSTYTSPFRTKVTISNFELNRWIAVRRAVCRTTRILGLIGTTVIFMVTACLATTFRGNNARTGRIDAGISLPLQRAYTVNLRGPVISSPVMVNDTVYVGSRDSSVYAFVRGKKLWEFKSRGWIDASPTLHEGRVFAGSRDGMLYVLDSRSGDSLDIIENNNEQCSTPLVVDSLVIFGRGGWNLQIDAYDIKNHEFAWYQENPQMVYSSAAVIDSTLCYADNGGYLSAVNVHSGEALWKYKTNGDTYLSSPAIDGDMVWFAPGNYDKNVYALMVKKGALVWKQSSAIEDAADPVPQKVVAAMLKYRPATRLKFIEGYNRLAKMSASQKQVLTALALNTDGAFVAFGGVTTSSVAVGDSLVYVVHKEFGHPKPRFTLTAFNKINGMERWRYSELRNCEQLGFCSSPLISDSLVFTGWGEGMFYAFDAMNGTKLWQDSLDSDILSSPTASGGMVTVATVKGTVYTYVTAGFKDSDFQNSTYSFPNPATGADLRVQVFAQKPGMLEMTVYNFANKPVATVNQSVPAGKYVWLWQLSNVANGVYFAYVRIKYNDGTIDKKIVKIAVTR